MRLFFFVPMCTIQGLETILVALACQSQLLNVLRAALHWTCSIWEILTLVCGSHIQGFLCLDIFALILRLTMFSVWFALPAIWSTCVFQEREPEISSQDTNLAFVTDFKTCPCSMYSLFTGFLDHVTCTTWHVEGLNLISHLVYHAD